MNYSVDDVKIKHLDLVSSHKIDYKRVMEEVFGYKNTFLDRKLLFTYKIKSIYKVLDELRSIQINDYGLTNELSIKIPKSIDNISFQARLEIGTVREKRGSLQEQIIDTVTIATFEETFNRSFDSDSPLFIKYRKSISERTLIEVMYAYNIIETAIVESNKLWNDLFKKVSVIDPDYEKVGGPGVLSRFSLLNTVKKTIADFGVSYKEAFLQPYVLIQTNQWEAACKSFIQHLMTESKERDMRSKRNLK